MQGFVDLQPENHRIGGAEWQAFVAIAKDVGVVAGATTAIVKLADVVVAWVQSLRRRHVIPKAKFQRPDRSPINLETATEVEVKEWFLSQTGQ